MYFMGPKWFWTIRTILVEYQSFGQAQFVLARSKSFWTGLNYKNLSLTKMIWTHPKQFGRSKIILNLWKNKSYLFITQYCLPSTYMSTKLKVVIEIFHHQITLSKPSKSKYFLHKVLIIGCKITTATLKFLWSPISHATDA